MKYQKTILAICLLGILQSAFSQIVVTVAGQVEISGSENGPAFDATFNNPHGIAVDNDGNVYTADRWSHLIRKISPDGMVSTFAGIANTSGDIDGDTSLALFNEPWGLCIDHLGNVLVADTRNNKIRRITQDGIVSTIAGTGNFGSSNGSSTSSTFGNPTGIVCDENGIIYVADHLTHVIRKIDQNGVVSTIAGTPFVMGATDGPGGFASFSRPYGITLDLDGNILVADEWNHKIRKIDPAGFVSTLAGNGIVGSSDGDTENASFNYPWDLTVDSLGNIFVADGYNYLIRKITPDGTVNAFVGTLETTGATDGMGTQATFSGATSIAISPLTKEIFVGDAYNHLVRKIIDLNQGVSVLLTNNVSPTICAGESIDLYASPDVYDNYFFYVDGEIAQTGSNPNFNTGELSVGTHQIQVIVQDNGNTFQSSPKTITVFDLPEASISIVGQPVFYEGDSVLLVANQGEEYLWTTGETTPVITVTESGDYQVEITNINGCVGLSEMISVTVLDNPESPTISLNGPSALCPGTSSLLVSNNAENNQWFKDGWPISGATNDRLEVNMAGIYQVQVILPSGTTVLSDEVTITMLPAFELDFTSNITNISTGGTVVFQINDPTLSDIEWNFGDITSTENSSTSTNPQHTYLLSGIYDVILSASNSEGCKNIVTKEAFIQVADGPDGPGGGSNTGDDLFIPTAFTPNGDGENDVLYVRGSDILDMTFNVYNHWGEMIFESTNPQIGWNGKQNGALVQNGNYVYCLSVTKTDGTTKQLAGRVSILR